jgi:hypothetical protein
MSVQTTYDDEMPVGLEGDWADGATRTRQTRTGKPEEKIPFGKVTQQTPGTVNGRNLPVADILIVSEDFAADDVITGKVIVDGEENAISQAWSTDHDGTIAALAAQIASKTGVDTCTVLSSDSDSRTIQLVADTAAGYKVVYFSDFEVAGSDPPDVSYDTSFDFEGTSLFNHVEPDSNGDYYYDTNRPMTVARQGAVFVKSTDANPNKRVYVSLVDVDATVKRGSIVTSAGSPATAKLWTGARFQDAVSGTGLVSMTAPFLS